MHTLKWDISDAHFLASYILHMVETNVIMTGVFKRFSSEGLIAAVDETEINRCGETFPGHYKREHPHAKEKHD